VLSALPYQAWWWCGYRDDKLAFAEGAKGQTRVSLQQRDAIHELRDTERGDQNPAWFPNGRQLMLVAGERGQERLVRVDPVTGERVIVGGLAGRQLRPSVSPDGKQVAFYSITRQALGESERKALDDEYDLALEDADGSNPRLLIQAVCFTSPPAWASDHEIVFGKWTGESCGLFVYDLATETTRQLLKRY
jgi:hypothetical protein